MGEQIVEQMYREQMYHSYAELSYAELNAELRGAADKGESMDVLLQLTLPIILILAFVVTTEIQSLNQDMEAMSAANAVLRQENSNLQEEMQLLTKELQGTETGRLKDELDMAILTLQHQLLLQAADETAAELRSDLQLDRYAALAPSVEDLVERRLHADFVRTSATLGMLFNGPGGFAKTEEKLRRTGMERFEHLTDEIFPEGEVSGFRRGKLKKVVPENQQSFAAKLAGRLHAIEKEASAVQLELILAWIVSKQAEVAVKSSSASTWKRIQTGREAAIVKESVKDFVNLKALVLLEVLNAQAAPMLDETCRLALNQNCSELL